MKGNGFDEEDFYITFFVLWSLGVLVVALWSIFRCIALGRLLTGFHSGSANFRSQIADLG
jgi:hypothetical protein